MRNKKEKVLDSKIKELAESMQPSVGVKVLDEYREMSETVKGAVEEFYEALDRIDEHDSIETIEEALESLSNACEANPSYKDVYEAAKREASEALADVIAKESLE